MIQGKFNEIQDFFSILNSNGIPYLILRNYENLLSPDLYVNGHGDIDMLCYNSQEIVKLIGAKTNRKDINRFIGDGTHYYFYLNGEKVSLDLRYVGDDYYCEEWQKNMLSNRLMENCYYIMNQEDYFYSLVYHAVLQKRYLSEDYKQRLSKMAKSLNISLQSNSENEFVELLNSFMEKNGYQYVYSKDIVVPNRFSLVDPSLIKTNYHLRWKHWKFDTKIKAIEAAVKIKHLLERKFHGHT